MTDGSLRTRIVLLVLPALAHQYLLLVIQHYDQYLAWPFSDAHKAALTTANYIYWLVSCYSVLVGAGATALVGRSVGARDFATAHRGTAQAIVLAIIFGGFGTIAALVGLPTLMRWLDLQGDAPRIAVEYLTPLAAVLVLQMIETAGIACLVGAGDTRTGLGVLAVVTLVNVPLAYGLSRGVGPFPNLGFLGIAYGTAASHAIGGLIVLALLLRGRSGLKISFAMLLPDREILRRLLRVSVPAAGDSLSGGLCQLWFLSLVNGLGPAASAAHGIALRWEAIGYLAAAGFGTAASSLVSQNLGAKNPHRAARAGWLCLFAAVAFLSLVGVLFAVMARPMCEQYTSPDESEVVNLGVTALRTVAFAMPALACVMILTAALRSAGDSRVPMFFTWFGFLAVRIPLAYLLIQYFELGLFGAWLAMLADLWLRGLLFDSEIRWRTLEVDPGLRDWDWQQLATSYTVMRREDFEMTANIDSPAEVVGKWTPSQQKEAMLLLAKSILSRETQSCVVLESNPASGKYIVSECAPFEVRSTPLSDMTPEERELARRAQGPEELESA